jgi:chemotaxis protein methyltransferase CheR
MIHFTILADLLRKRSGLALGEEKLYLLETRLSPLLRKHGFADLDQLATYIAQHAGSEIEQAVIEAMATHETLFFRDAKPFEHLRMNVLPWLLSGRPKGASLRVWSAATSTGQEAYSLAMILAESGRLADYRVEILGTDIAREPVARASKGLYSQYEVQRGLSVHQLIRHFTRQGDQWQIKPSLQAICGFRRWNLLDDPAPLGTFDIIFCRNVLMYFDIPTRRRVVAALARRLTPGGLLYLGLTEISSEATDGLSRVSSAHAAFQALPETAGAA